MIKNNYSLFKSDKLKICFVQTRGKEGNHGRKDRDSSASCVSFGASIIQKDLEYQFDFAPLQNIKEYDFALISITSVVEIERIIKDGSGTDTDKGDCVVIAGGMGCLNIYPLIDLLDVAVFGRAEGQINGIIAGENYTNVWRKNKDPFFEKGYEIRQAKKLLPGEAGIGCPNKCHYCQYTRIRKHFKNKETGYRAADLTNNIYEDDWKRINFRQGRNQTAWDGLTQKTRFKAGKYLKDSHIINKLTELRMRNYEKTTNIKIYQIVGYPWETPKTIERDLRNIRELLFKADGNTGGRIFIMMTFTPFSPEPFTVFENRNVQFNDWRELLLNYSAGHNRLRQLYNGNKIEAMILPQIPGVYTLKKRIALNRATLNNRRSVADFVKAENNKMDFEYKERLWLKDECLQRR